MKYLKMSIPFVFGLFFVSFAMAGEGKERSHITEKVLPSSNIEFVQFKPLLSQPGRQTNLKLSYRQEDVEIVRPEGWISPKRALLLSAILPGTGEFYAGSKMKAAGFFGIEVISWIGFIINDSNGEDIENEYITFANDNWEIDRYILWLADFGSLFSLDQFYIDANRTIVDYETLNKAEGLDEGYGFSHQLPSILEDPQQHYELIGKYEQFNPGWLDTDLDSISQNRISYNDLRFDSNQAFKRATTFASFAIINHVFSAIDAAWTTKIRNRRLYASVRLEPRIRHGDMVHMAVLQVKW